MKMQLILRIAILAEWACVGTNLALSSLLQPALPPLLRDFLAQESAQGLEAHEVLLLPVAVLIFALGVTGAIGLFFLQRWARWVYLSGVAIAFLCVPFMGPTVEHGFAETFSEACGTLTGVVLAIAFFTDALSKKSQTAEPPRPAEPSSAGAAEGR